MHIPISLDQIMGVLSPVLLFIHYVLTHKKLTRQDTELRKIYVLANGNLSKAQQDVKELTAQVEKLRGRLKSIQESQSQAEPEKLVAPTKDHGQPS